MLLIALWVRSYWRIDSLYFQLEQTPTIGFLAIQGKLLIGSETSGTAGTQFKVGSVLLDAWMVNTFPVKGNRIGFGKKSFRSGTLYLMPMYVFVVSFSICAISPWIGWSKRFSLRTLLIVTTLVAVVLGLIVWGCQ